ncbi:MAG: asparagine synthase (glutamine-hydrolyzing) [Methylococcales bacterium]|nr:asparagine synthase (glutamine-hydrolyzing) [Methylococcales bacterium]
MHPILQFIIPITMCGFSGFLHSNHFPDQPLPILKAMGLAIIHRGPDDGGEWWDAATGIGLSHRRLSILDLSPAGHQPMESGCGRFVIAFNGEIYNHNELRSALAGQAWRGHSDTETLLAACAAWGIEATLKKCVGMFAFALWDKHKQTLTLARDRLGEKPLYYGWQGTSFLFGSELKALKAHPAFTADINRDALALLMRYNYIPAPYSIWQGIHKLQPGCWLTVSTNQREPQISTYWSGKDCVTTGLATPFTGTATQAVAELEAVLMQAVGQQMVADVPLGAFLSGGVDSSAIVALMQAQSSRPVKTFAIGFNEATYNEAHYAKAVAQHLGTEHTELYVTAQDAMNVIPKLPTLYDEPFSDSSQIPTFLVAEMARQHVTVSLSGDAGDELFCGYNRYLQTHHLWGKISRLPLAVRQAIAYSLTRLSPSAWNRLASPFMNLAPERFKHLNLGDKLHKGSGVLSYQTIDELYLDLISHWKDPASLVLGATEPLTLLTNPSLQPATPTDIERMMALDMLSYLPDDILTKVDRAAMGVSLETRVPFLDHRVVEFAWRLPLEYKLREGVGKWALREVLYKHVPKTLIERPKMGFGVPIDVWLRGPLRDWAESLLNEDRLRQEGYFNPQLVQAKWAEHLSGKRNWHYYLWDVLMFQAWLEQQ